MNATETIDERTPGHDSIPSHIKTLMKKFSSRQKDFPDRVDCTEPCNCHSGACAFAGRIRERIGHPASAFAKFPRGSIPIACGQCRNSFG